MNVFLCTKRPRSVNAKGTATYKRLIQEAFDKYCERSITDSPTYARIYLFKNVAHQLDADNLSKPILDALVGVIYSDDKFVELRQSGIIDLQRDDVAEFDISNVPDTVLEDFISYLDSEDYLVYAEFGVLTKDKFVFGQ